MSRVPLSAVAAFAALVAIQGAAANTSGRVIPVDTMAVPRAAHTATLLADGTVLVAGGCSVNGCELDARAGSTELYDPRSRSFRAGPRLSRWRVSHAAVRLPGGRVLVFGGWSRNGLARTAELYVPARRAFVPGGEMVTPRGGFSATLLRDGRVLVVGGVAGGVHLASAELYDPRTGRFSPTGSMETPRFAHTATLLRDGRVLVVGGSRADGEVIASAELFDPVTRRFAPAGSMAVRRHKHGAARLPDGRVLVVGGSDERDGFGQQGSAELYDPARGEFLRTGDLAARRFKLGDTVVLLPSGELLVAGGAAEVEAYVPGRSSFRTVGRVDASRAFATATRLRNGNVLIVGGYDPRIAPTPRAWMYRAGR